MHLARLSQQLNARCCCCCCCCCRRLVSLSALILCLALLTTSPCFPSALQLGNSVAATTVSPTTTSPTGATNTTTTTTTTRPTQAAPTTSNTSGANATTTSASAPSTTGSSYRQQTAKQLQQQTQQQDESMQINAKTNSTPHKSANWFDETSSQRRRFQQRWRSLKQQQLQQQPLLQQQLAPPPPLDGNADSAAPFQAMIAARPSSQRKQNSARGRLNGVNDEQEQQVGESAANAPGTAAAAAAANTGSDSSQYGLPSWFNYNAFKRLYGKTYGSRQENELHRRIYLGTALKVFEQRALYRLGRLEALASINELSDLTGDQLDEFKERHRKPGAAQAAGPARANLTSTTTARAPARPPQCCSHDQVFARIIEMLSAATEAGDTALGRALVDELEQRPLAENEAEAEAEAETTTTTTTTIATPADQVNDSSSANQVVAAAGFRRRPRGDWPEDVLAARQSDSGAARTAAGLALDEQIGRAILLDDDGAYNEEEQQQQQRQIGGQLSASVWPVPSTRPRGSAADAAASGRGGGDHHHHHHHHDDDATKQRANYQQTARGAAATGAPSSLFAATSPLGAPPHRPAPKLDVRPDEGPNGEAAGDKRRLVQMIERPADSGARQPASSSAKTVGRGGPAPAPLVYEAELTDEPQRRAVTGELPAGTGSGAGSAARVKRPPSSGQDQPPAIGGAPLEAGASDRRQWQKQQQQQQQWPRHRPPDADINRSSAGDTHRGRNDYREPGVRAGVAEALQAQLDEQLSPSSPSGRELARLLSAYLGKSVFVRAVVGGGASSGAQQQAGGASKTTTTTTTATTATTANNQQQPPPPVPSEGARTRRNQPAQPAPRDRHERAG